MTVWLLTWLWQGTVLWLIAATLLKAKRLNASTRYVVWWGALLAVLWLGYVSSPYRFVEPIPVPVPVQGADPNGPEFAREAYLQVTEASPLVVSILLGVWAAVALMKLVRLVPTLHAVYALRDRSRAFPAHVESQLPLWLEARTNGRRAELMVCDEVPGATVLGFQRPAIAVPTSLIETLTVDEIDQIVLHEHAHVQRRDDWARLAQGLLQAVLWIHPAVALIGRALNHECEMACDERVVARTGLPKAYARCLTRAAEVRMRTRVGPMLLPALFGRPHHLVRRVDRLLAVKGRTRCKVSPLAATAAACAIVAVSVQLNALPLIGQQIEIVLPQVASVGPPWRAIAESRSPMAAPGATYAITSPIASTVAPASQTATVDKPPFAQIAMADKPTFAPTLHIATVDEPIETLSARSITPEYTNPDAHPSSSDEPSRWRAAAAPGVEIASAARKTGVGIASAFSRAGVSLARSF
jgi:beta-lactamase regulating signal transducer with metallopeptidase domain